MKNYILFDWDGNLAKTLDVWLEACRIPLQKRGLILTDEEIASCFGMPIERFGQWGITDVDATVTEMDEIAARMLPEAELYPDAIEVLDNLKSQGKKMALITTSFRANVINLLNKYGMHHYFDVVIAYEDTKEHKPHAEPLEKALLELSGNKEEAIMIGDSDKDLGAALNTGVDSILFYPPEHAKFYKLEDLKKFDPTHIVHDFRDIINIVG